MSLLACASIMFIAAAARLGVFAAAISHYRCFPGFLVFILLKLVFNILAIDAIAERLNILHCWGMG